MQLLMLIVGVALGAAWMFALPVYLGIAGGAWWGALLWGTVTSLFHRPLVSYNLMRSSMEDGTLARFIAYRLVASLPFGGICVGVYLFAQWWARG